MNWATRNDAQTWLANTHLWACMWPSQRERVTDRLWRAYKAGALEGMDAAEKADALAELAMEATRHG